MSAADAAERKISVSPSMGRVELSSQIKMEGMQRERMAAEFQDRLQDLQAELTSVSSVMAKMPGAYDVNTYISDMAQRLDNMSKKYDVLDSRMRQLESPEDA